MAIRLGIVGGGQLGYFLCAAARRLGVRTTVLNPVAECPAARSADRVLAGGFDDLSAAAALAADSDVITFEIETVAPEVLKYLGGRARAGDLRVAPGPEILLILQNKALQKRWLVRNGIPTPDFVHLPGGPLDVDGLLRRFGLPLVQKSAVGGFDGRGVQILRRRDQLAALWESPSIVEAFVPGATEIAVLVARAVDGSLRTYEPVLLEMDEACNALGTVVSPAPLDDSVRRRVRRLAGDIVTGLEGVGLFAVEMFVTPDQDVLVNEISPRVHNSGHLTLEACQTSQFTQHLRAVLGLPLGPVEQRVPVAVMKNLLHGACFDRLCDLGGFDTMDSRTATALHWYGKREGRPFRKMGHVTALGENVERAGRRAESAVRALAVMGAEVFS
ncbi:MAG: 5-(carboxyamino)imidazole ribonucleotide synthase [Pseudomonadales bacterium]